MTVNNASTSKNVGIDQHFNHTEACAKLVIGLRAVRENAVRDVENLENVIVIFYKNFEVLKEIVYHRLGWYMDGSYDTPASGCVHYKRNIKFQAPCCKRWVACEQCHDEMFPDHTMDK